MKPSLPPIAHLGQLARLQLAEDLRDEFAAETRLETRPVVLGEQTASALACVHVRRIPAKR